VAISVLDVRGTAVPPRVRVPSLRLVPSVPGVPGVPGVPVPVAAPVATVRRLPVAVLTAGLLGIGEAVGLLAVALTGLDGALAASVLLPGRLVAVGLVVLAGWIVLAAGGGAALLDGAGRRLVAAVAYAELVLLGLVGCVGVSTSLIVPPATMPLPLLLLVAAAVPVGKLLLVGSPSAVRWIADGPRVRERRTDPAAAHRLLATLTLGAIGLSLAAVAVLTPVEAGGVGEPASAVFSQH
jgi:hypothetical protein